MSGAQSRNSQASVAGGKHVRGWNRAALQVSGGLVGKNGGWLSGTEEGDPLADSMWDHVQMPVRDSPGTEMGRPVRCGLCPRCSLLSLPGLMPGFLHDSPGGDLGLQSICSSLSQPTWPSHCSPAIKIIHVWLHLYEDGSGGRGYG